MNGRNKRYPSVLIGTWINTLGYACFFIGGIDNLRNGVSPFLCLAFLIPVNHIYFPAFIAFSAGIGYPVTVCVKDIFFS